MSYHGTTPGKLESISVAPPWNCGSRTEKWLNSSWGYKTTFQFHSGGDIHTIFFQNMYALSQVRRDGSSQHLSSKINMALLSNQQVTECETFRNAVSAFLSLPSELLSCSYSILKLHPEMKACPWKFSCILNHTRTENMYFTEGKKKIPIPILIVFCLSLVLSVLNKIQSVCSTSLLYGWWQSRWGEQIPRAADSTPREFSRWQQQTWASSNSSVSF